MIEHYEYKKILEKSLHERRDESLNEAASQRIIDECLELLTAQTQKKCPGLY